MDTVDRRSCVPKRYLVTFLAFAGMSCLYLMRMNLSIAIVDMTSAKHVSTEKTNLKEAEFKWSSVQKGLILSVFSYGYLLSPLGGVLAIRFGGCTVFGLGIAITAVITVLSPALIRLNVFVYGFARMLEGIFESFAMASSADIFIYWALPKEKTRFNVITFSGCAFGTAINYPLCGFIAAEFGWEAIFYVTGGISLCWYCAWLLFVRDTPAKDDCMLHSEKFKLQQNVNYEASRTEKVKYPWREILKSLPVWALSSEMFTFAFGLSFVTFCLPLYVNDVYGGANMKHIGLISGIPNICGVLGQLGGAFLADYLRTRKIISISKVHKIFIGIGKISTMLLFVIVGLWTNFLGSIVCFSVLRFINGLNEASYQVLPEDMSCRYASFVKGMTITSLAIGLILNPTILGFMVKNKTRSEWNTYFLLLGIINTGGLIIFQIFGSGKRQPWSDSMDREYGERNDSANIHLKEKTQT